MNNEKKVLRLSVKEPWFSMIVSGQKTEEYRDMKPYWDARLFNNAWGGYNAHRHGIDAYTHVLIVNGYSDKRPRIEKAIRQVRVGKPRKGWCPDGMLGHECYVIELED